MKMMAVDLTCVKKRLRMRNRTSAAKLTRKNMLHIRQKLTCILSAFGCEAVVRKPRNETKFQSTFQPLSQKNQIHVVRLLASQSQHPHSACSSSSRVRNSKIVKTKHNSVTPEIDSRVKFVSSGRGAEAKHAIPMAQIAQPTVRGTRCELSNRTSMKSQVITERAMTRPAITIEPLICHRIFRRALWPRESRSRSSSWCLSLVSFLLRLRRAVQYITLSHRHVLKHAGGYGRLLS
mmetsp:Transcript_48902/g.114982  ORF Transcript_48902/g.114982 Transcript_48902/m.114982 type:complete len:235 (+) Transcript_48902:971-1675(+)